MLPQLFDNKPIKNNQQEKINAFLAEVELCGGPTMSLRTLEKFVYTAPDAVRKDNDYCYLIGLLFSRYMYEVVGDFDPNAQIGPYAPFEELEQFIMAEGTPEESGNESKQMTMLRGFYDGRLIHEELGGINNDDQETPTENM